MNDLVSIVVPFFNRERFLAQTIQSILRQNHARIELILVDNGSADRSFSIAQSFSDPRIRHLRIRKNRSKAAAVNQAFTLVRGPWVAVFDSDDLMTSDSLTKRISFLNRHPRALAVIGGVNRLIDESGRALSKNHPLQPYARAVRSCVRQMSRRLGGLIPELFVYGRCPLNPMGATLFRREAMKKVGPLNERFAPADDQEYLYRFSLLQPLPFLDSPVLFYRVHGHNLSFRVTPQGLEGHPAFSRLQARLRKRHERLFR